MFGTLLFGWVAAGALALGAPLDAVQSTADAIWGSDAPTISHCAPKTICTDWTADR